MTDCTRLRSAVPPFAAAACAVVALGLALGPATLAAAPKIVRPPEATPATPATKSASTPQAKAAAAPVAAKPTPRSATGTKALALPTRRPIVLDALHVEGKTEAPRVLFVHAGPTVALEDAPEHPSYLRDDFTAALSSPVRVRVRTGAAQRPSTAGGNR